MKYLIILLFVVNCFALKTTILFEGDVASEDMWKEGFLIEVEIKSVEYKNNKLIIIREYDYYTTMSESKQIWKEIYYAKGILF